MTTSFIENQLQRINSELQTHTPPPQLLVATKYASVEALQLIIDNGIRYIGENKVQDAMAKKEQLLDPTQVEWHMIGHLQSNKINKAIETFDVIESIDSLGLLEKLNTSLEQKNKTIKGYLQINIGNDKDKFGFSYNNIMSHHKKFHGFQNIKIQGIMIVTPLNCSESDRRKLFKKSYSLFKWLQDKYSEIKILSMGMSNDYKIAIEEGATLIRLGQTIFKEKNE
tara:strand:+ start:789 stop:1463 length:675 start_codon:yes stop_codon:yes gene_type:complete